MTKRLIECVPNFSEGRDLSVIDRIREAIEAVSGVTVLDVDPGHSTNRTVVTFVGPPEEAAEAAFQAVRRAAELIDMRRHTGEHPRFGATDVCPLVPVSGVSMEEAVHLARRLGKRIGDELGIPVYCYEQAALQEERRDLAAVRAGEYEGLRDKLADPAWRPDFGPTLFNASAGATAVGARGFLVAYNVNLNTTSTRRANAVAFDVRERGRAKRSGDPLTGEIVRDGDGVPVMIPGSLEAVKAIGWYIEEYGIAQISMNLTNLDVTPLHVAFDETRRKARARGLRVTGSELVGLVPLSSLLEAGRYFLAKQQRSLGVSDSELIKIAVRSLGLDELSPFDSREKVIEYAIAGDADELLAIMPVASFVEETASESPAPGGGSVAATVGALGAALGTMVANLSAHKRGWDERWQEFSDWAERGKGLHTALTAQIDEDTRAFNAVLAAYRLPQRTDDERTARADSVETAIKGAIDVPYRIMELALESMTVIQAMAEIGSPSSVSDAGVGALCARTAVLAAFLNVRTNAGECRDRPWTAERLQKGEAMQREAIRRETDILAIVQRALG
ncbi:MAG: glutamate formimidoyltransferase [Acidobacteriota bacterium]|nr:glutamate formimidoyltransferase [Acidobacteriota bacterium]